MVQRVDVAVDVHVDTTGDLTPKAITWVNDDESITQYNIDKITEKIKAANLKVGGCGWRYTVYINGRETYLYFDLITNNWFVQGKV